MGLGPRMREDEIYQFLAVKESFPVGMSLSFGKLQHHLAAKFSRAMGQFGSGPRLVIGVMHRVIPTHSVDGHEYRPIGLNPAP